MNLIDFTMNYKTDIEKLGIKATKHGGYSYLSWSHCQKVMKELDPNSCYKMIFNENDQSYIWGGMVRIELFFNGKTTEHAYPVLDSFNNGIKKVDGKWHFVTKPTKSNPKSQIKEEITSFDINNAQMRGFAKLFSMETGIGLNIFTGEDLEQYKDLGKAQEEQEEIKKKLEEQKKLELEKKIELKEARNNLVELVTLYCKETGNNQNEIYETYKITKASGVKDLEETIKKIKVLRAEFYAQPENKLGENNGIE